MMASFKMRARNERVCSVAMSKRRGGRRKGYALIGIARDCQRAAESPQFWACNFPHFGGVGDQPFE